jgi:nicotinamide riboside transporter PnuC
MSWILVILSIAGVILNIYKRKECFVIWGITNLGWAIYDFKIGAYAQGVLFAVYFGLAVWGIIKWRKEEVCLLK